MVFDAFRKQPSTDASPAVTPLWRRGAASLALGAMLGTTGVAGLSALPTVTLPTAHAADTSDPDASETTKFRITFSDPSQWYGAGAPEPPADLGNVYVKLTNVDDSSIVYYSDPEQKGTWKERDGHFYQDFGDADLKVGKYEVEVIGLDAERYHLEDTTPDDVDINDNAEHPYIETGKVISIGGYVQSAWIDADLNLSTYVEPRYENLDVRRGEEDYTLTPTLADEKGERYLDPRDPDYESIEYARSSARYSFAEGQDLPDAISIDEKTGAITVRHDTPAGTYTPPRHGHL